MKIEKQDRDIVVKVSDVHVPYHDPRTVRLVISFCQYLKPKILVLDEMIDFYSISKYCKDPARINSLQRDVNTTKHILKRFREALPETTIYMVKSNHDDRLKSYLHTHAKELSNLDCLQFEELMGLNELNIKYVDDLTYRGVLYKHGSVIKKGSSATARAEFEKENVSGGSGHSHRLGIYYRTQRNGKFVWVETGCCCKTTNIEYIDGTADWQQGLGVWTFQKNSNSFQVTVLPIINYEIIWGSRTFGLKGYK